MSRKLRDFGLDEQVPGQPGTTRSTDFGIEQRLDLMMVFMGLMDELAMPWILENYGLIDDLECDDILEQFEHGSDPEFVLLRIVRRAYFEFYNPTRLLH